LIYKKYNFFKGIRKVANVVYKTFTRPTSRPLG